MLHRLWKPWFVYRPTQLLRRIRCDLRQSVPGYRPLRVAWGLDVIADPTKTIGRCICTTGIYDLAVSEVIARLAQPGETVIDVGANVGYMTLLARVVVSPRGRVIAFEPHPELYRVALDNVALSERHAAAAPVELHNLALADRTGTAELAVPEEFNRNDGIARLNWQRSGDSRAISVDVATIDSMVGSEPVGLLKLDVEGHELSVLQGAQIALASRRIRHIVFENHEGHDSATVRYLAASGYAIFALGWSMRGLKLAPIGGGELATRYEAPSCLATLAPEEALARCRERGWRVLSRRLVRRCTDHPRFEAGPTPAVA
jgi:FkbM family methyltransferase